ncbi:MAG: DUF4185 domain-containing protein [Nocardioides sp.]|nr:DUF4185 domain-containing protein [Nocardioides sp.]
MADQVVDGEDQARGSAVSWRRVFPRPVAILCLVVLIGQAVLLVSLARSAEIGKPRHVPIAVVTAPVVAQALVGQANAMEDQPFDAHVAKDADAALTGLREGSVVAALKVDLSGTKDVLLLNKANDSRLNDAVQDRIDAVEGTYDRTTTIKEVDTASGEPRLAHNLTLAANVIAFLFVLVASMFLGPVTRTLGRGLLRHAALAGVAMLAAGVLVGLPVLGSLGQTVEAMLLIALAVMVVGSATLALEALAGLSGLAIAATLFFVQAAPLLLSADVRLFPQPWPTVVPLTPVGAMDEALTNLISFDDVPGTGVPVLILVVWLVVSWLTSLVARRVRSRFGVDLRGSTPAPSRRTKVLWRLRVAAVVVPATALLLALVVAAPRHAVAEPEAMPSRASETECVRTGPVRSIKDLNRVAGELRGSGEFQGGDVGASVRLQDGRMLFVFGDTLRSADYEGQRFVRNSMLVMDRGCLQVVTPADHGAIIPDRTGGRPGESVGYWPMSIGRQQRPGYDLVAISAQRVRTVGADEFDFENLGPSIAVFIVPRGGTPQLIDQRDIGEDDPDRDRPTWGAASAVKHGWAYLYGTASPGEDYVFGFSLSVARVRPDAILDRSKWRFWNGSEWVRDVEAAAKLIPAKGGVSQTLSVFEQDGTWYALSKRDEFLGTDLTVWTAPSPTGPFTAGEPLAKMPSDTVKGELRYMPLAHPGLLDEPRSMVVSYSRNRTDINQVIKNPLLYRPRFLRVDLP